MGRGKLKMIMMVVRGVRGEAGGIVLGFVLFNSSMFLLHVSYRFERRRHLQMHANLCGAERLLLIFA